MGKNHEAEIDKICEDMKKLIMKPEHTPTEVDAIHHYSEVIYYLTVTDAMNEAKDKGEFSMNMTPTGVDGRSMRMMPVYDYSMEDRSMAGRRGRDNDNDGRYSEMHGRMPRDVYNRESERYYGRY